MKKLILFTVVTLLLSCAQQNKERSDAVDCTIVFTENPTAQIRDAVGSVEYIALETTENSIYNEPHKMIVRGGRIFIGDLLMHKIAVFDLSGKFLLSIDRKGRGAQEYLEMKNFTVDGKNIYIIDNYTHKLMAYDIDGGDFLWSKALPVVAWDLSVFNNGDFIFATAPLNGGKFSVEQSRHRIFITDNDLTIKERLFEYGDKETDPIGKMAYFSDTEDEIVYNTCGSDMFYIFSKSDVNNMKSTLVDFGSRKVQDKHRSSQKDIAEHEYHYISSTPLVCGDYVMLEINTDNRFNYLYNDRTGELMRNPSQEEGAFNALMYPIGSYKNKLVAVLDGPELYQSLVDYGFTPAPASVEKHIAEGGATLMVYTLK